MLVCRPQVLERQTVELFLNFCEDLIVVRPVVELCWEDFDLKSTLGTAVMAYFEVAVPNVRSKVQYSVQDSTVILLS
jgi:hypothetical protein